MADHEKGRAASEGAFGTGIVERLYLNEHDADRARELFSSSRAPEPDADQPAAYDARVAFINFKEDGTLALRSGTREAADWEVEMVKSLCPELHQHLVIGYGRKFA